MTGGGEGEKRKTMATRRGGWEGGGEEGRMERRTMGGVERRGRARGRDRRKLCHCAFFSRRGRCLAWICRCLDARTENGNLFFSTAATAELIYLWMARAVEKKKTCDLYVLPTARALNTKGMSVDVSSTHVINYIAVPAHVKHILF